MKTPSIRSKLLGALLFTSASVLFLSGLVLLLYEFASYKQATAQNLTTLGRAVAANVTGALAFDDTKVAVEILSSLQAEPHVRFACLYDKAGQLYAAWSAQEPPPPAYPAAPGPDGIRFGARHVLLVQPVMQAQARIGTLLVKEDLSGLMARVSTYGLVVLLVVGSSAVFALLLSRFFERRLTRPILSLAGTARQVSQHKDFSLRAPEITRDELGELTHAFNEMLSEIQAHQRQLLAELTGREKAETEAREAEARFRALAENIPQLAWISEADGSTIWYNRRWYDYTGTTLERMKGWGWQAVHDPAHVGRVVATFKQALQTGTPWEDTFPLRRKDGTYRWFLSRAFPIRNEQGQITRWFGTNTDITELRETQEALADAKAQLQQHAENLEQIVAQRTAQLREANENLQTFTYSAAHDLRSPLRAIRSFANIILEDFGQTLEPELLAHLQRISASVQQMERLLNDLLEYSRISRAELKLEPVSLQAATRDALALLQAEIQSKHATVTIAQPLPTVHGHPATLVLLLQNLLSNAIKFMPAGRPPRIAVYAEPGTPTPSPSESDRPAAHTQVEPNGLHPGETTHAPGHAGAFVRLVVQDNGIGIGAEHRSKLFGAFQRFVSAGAYPGTGLGLAIVRKGAERMGGRVGVESEPGRGSRFWLELQEEDSLS
jgi:PAS domain S-box-containing protein